MVRVDAGEVPEPVRQREIAADMDLEVARLGSGGDREIRQARFLHAAECGGAADLEWRFHVEDHGICGVVTHVAVKIFTANGVRLVGDECADYPFVLLCSGSFGGHGDACVAEGFVGLRKG